MATHVEADIEVKRFGFASDDAGNRLLFPHAQMQKLEGRSGGIAYGATDCGFEALEGRLDTLRWRSDAASIGSAWLRDDAGRFDMVAERAEFPHGLMLVRADHGLELVSQHVSFSELRLTIKGPFTRSTPAAATSEEPALRQERLRFLDSLSGRIYLTAAVQLDLPVLGLRSLDQELRVPIQEGSLDFHALEKGLDWLEGRFLDIKYDDSLLKVQWKVPIFGSSHDLITWPLDQDASTLAAFGRVPVRSLADFRLASSDETKPAKEDPKKRKVLQAFALDAIDIALSLLAPRNLEVGGGMIMFGGEDQPGLVDLKVTGAIRDRGPGSLQGAIGSIDTTIKDLRLGPLGITADRLTFDGLDQLEVTFDGFRPTAVTVVVHRVTATNLAIKIGR
ncbi:MAG: hypothetical protein JWO36_4432 [Myxococcales bacterium]|nr:hypothetical protein [Myxococcales bacterium]